MLHSETKDFFFFCFPSSKMLQCAQIEVSKNCMRSQVMHSHSQHDYAVEGTFKHITFRNACNGAVELTVTMGTNIKRLQESESSSLRFVNIFPGLAKSIFCAFFFSLERCNRHRASFLVQR